MNNEKLTWQDLTFDTNAVIEASAGTGKTWTLEHIVEKLVTRKENPIDIRQILLVTFTEKAAGELKDRIRKILSKAGRSEHVDEATICTIHSFCQQILAEYPFESGADMGADIGGSDDAHCTQAVHNVLASKEFRDAHAEDFADLMAAWDPKGQVDSLARDAEDSLKGIIKDDNFEEWLQQGGTGCGVADQLETAIGRLPGWNEMGAGGYVLAHTNNGTTIRDRANWNAKQLAFFGGLDENLRVILDANQPMQRQMEALNYVANGKIDFRLYMWDGRRVNGVFCECAGFGAYAEVKKLAGLRATVLREWLLRDVVSLAYPEFIRLKSRSAQMTFDDLIREAARLVEMASGTAATESQKKFLERVRKRYRIALVDEFQDTDARQWSLFKRLFADIGRLAIVGDPKQAIYGWRGADLATYLRAKAEIESKGGQSVSLDTMYRSTKEMVADFNTMFQSGWFDGMAAGGKAISYDEVHFPRSDAPEKVRDFAYPQGEHAVEWLESGSGLREFAENAANEMIRLSKDQQWKNILSWDEMCVLVRTHRDGEMVRDVLRRKNIPCRIYKEAGIYASIEAESILALFDYLSMPRRVGNLSALLLTPLFNVAPSDLEKRLATGDALFDRLCDRWRSLAEKRDWIRLFASIIRNTDAKWQPSGYRQIFDRLLEKYARSTALSEFAAGLRELKAGDASAGENGNIRNRADEGPAVQIMTMHVAKGLEFGAVFVAGGFSGFSKMSNEKKDREIDEQKRLFYVALTRASFKLYLPWSVSAGEAGIGKTDSALKTYLGTAIRALCLDDVARRHRNPGQQKLIPPNTVTDRKPEECAPSRGMKGWRFKWDSFSSLNRHSAPNAVVAQEAKKENDEPTDAAPSPRQSLLPKGALSGTAFHEVMEILCGNDGQDGRIGFEIGKNDDFESLVNEAGGKKSALLEIARRRLAANGVANRIGADGAESTARTLARMAWNALRTPLDFGGERFALCDIGPQDRKAEVNFVLDEGLLLAAGEKREGALNGSIDLLVRRGDHYYIVDWKTNALDGYDAESVTAAMDAAGYHLQYKIYALAAEKWLGGSVVKGAAYLFVRGGETGENRSGTFVYDLTDAERERFRSQFSDRLRADAADEDDGMEEEK